MKEVKGDLLTLAENGEFDVIVHGCNCFHTMGAGIALQLAQKYPSVPHADKRDSVYGDPEKMGTYTKAIVKDICYEEFTVINGYTQYGIGIAPHENRELAIKLLFEKIANDFPDARIGIPFIGAWIAGGDWNSIKQIISTALLGLDFTLVEYAP